ncbi:tetratricopeptide repeat protein [Inquilinus limosus]|uniref:tetratricopeptide repeat protein n=1 Tax=Inquilinus limosus TaxID=171674 RepID=UPI00068F4044|nr:tetratricopeptide repeat protein [Inquilinus limosus]
MSVIVDRLPLPARTGSATRRHAAVVLATALMLVGGATPAFCSPLDDAQAALDAGDYEKARSLWLRLAEQGDARASYGMGLLYEGGDGVDIDAAEAARWYRKAADQGYAPAQERLGGFYHFGLAATQDDAEAAAWYRKAADQGLAEAQYDLGILYEQGQGVPQDPAEAARWYRRAADQGYPKAMGGLGLLYLDGTGVPKDAVAGLTLILLERRLGDEIERDVTDELLAQIERQHPLSQQQRDRAAAAARQWHPGSPLPLP